MSQIASLLESNKTDFLSTLREKMRIASKHNWREKVFVQAVKALLVEHHYAIEPSRSYANNLGLQCDIAATKSVTYMIEIKRFRSPSACVSVAGGTLEEWIGELKGFPRDFLIDVAKVVLATNEQINIEGIAIAFIAFDKDITKDELSVRIEIGAKISTTFNLQNIVIDFGIFNDNNNKPVRLIAICLASKFK